MNFSICRLVSSIPSSVKRSPSRGHRSALGVGGRSTCRSQVVICNGGSLSCQHALAAGVPVIGIPGNLDQYLNMGAFAKAGVGELISADRFSRAALHRAMGRVLGNRDYAARAGELAHRFAEYDAGARFRGLLERIRTATRR